MAFPRETRRPDDILGDVYGYPDDSKKKKFSIFFDMSDKEQAEVYNKLMAIGKNRREWLILDILIQYFSRGTTMEQLVNAVENLSIAMKATKNPPQITVNVDVPAQASIPIAAMSNRIIESERKNPGIMPAFASGTVSLEEVASTISPVNSAEEPVGEDFDSLVDNVFQAGVQRGGSIQ